MGAEVLRWAEVVQQRRAMEGPHLPSLRDGPLLSRREKGFALDTAGLSAPKAC